MPLKAPTQKVIKIVTNALPDASGINTPECLEGINGRKYNMQGIARQNRPQRNHILYKHSKDWWVWKVNKKAIFAL